MAVLGSGVAAVASLLTSLRAIGLTPTCVDHTWVDPTWADHTCIHPAILGVNPPVLGSRFTLLGLTLLGLAVRGLILPGLAVLG